MAICQPSAVTRRSHPPANRARAGGSEEPAGQIPVTSPTHRYSVGDQVIFHPPPTLPEFAGAYSIERLLPLSGAGPSYLIRRLKDGHVRSVVEQELVDAHSVVSKPKKRRKTGFAVGRRETSGLEFISENEGEAGVRPRKL